MALRSPFPYIGGKFSSVKWLLKYLPYDNAYIEPFGGSAVVLLNRKPSDVETYNDINRNIVNFFRVIRKHLEEFRQLFYLTPYSRIEFEEANYKLYHPPDDYEPVQHAVDFFNLARRCFGGMQCENASFGYTKESSRRGMGQLISAELNALRDLPDVVHRLRMVQIKCRDALKVIKQYDFPGAVFYIDPPYLDTAQKGYGSGYTLNDHKELINVLESVRGRWALSGYHNKKTDGLLSGYNFVERRVALRTARERTRAYRTEVLWANYDLKSVNNTKYKTLEAYF
jgi:DNA adenine methylase